jgi:hypothetical protein
MTRRILAILASSVISYAQIAPAVTGTYHFTAPQTTQSLQEAATVVRTVAEVPQVSADASTATLTFTGPAESVNFAAWALAQIDKAAGDNAIHEYKLPSGDIGRVTFVPGLQTPQASQELLTILRTVADAQKIFSFSANQAIVVRGPEWEVAFAEWIIAHVRQPRPEKPDSAPPEFIVGGPDFRGLGHGARINFLSNMTSQQGMQELLTVLRTVGDVQKIFSLSSSHAVVFRANDSDLQRAEWMIHCMDLPAGEPLDAVVFTAAGDDVTRAFHLRDAPPEWLRTAVTGLRTEVKIKRVFASTMSSTIFVRGSTDQIAAAMVWMTSHNALFE